MSGNPLFSDRSKWPIYVGVNHESLVDKRERRCIGSETWLGRLRNEGMNACHRDCRPLLARLNDVNRALALHDGQAAARQTPPAGRFCLRGPSMGRRALQAVRQTLEEQLWPPETEWETSEQSRA